MRQQGKEYTPGTTVFAKLKGYPWWPARIESDKNVPEKVLKQKSKSSKGTLYTVFFYGSRDYGFFGPDAIRPFDPANVQVDLKAKKFKTKDLEMAIRQALNPALLTELEEEEDEEMEEEEEEEEDPKSKKGKRKSNSVAPKTNVKAAPAKRKNRKATTDSNKMQESKSEQVQQERKKRRKSMSVENEEEEDRKATTKDGVVGKKSPEYKKIYYLRHKLQRFVYNKKEGEIPKEDYPKIINVIKEIEEAPMTYSFLKDTKIGKVVKAATAYPFERNDDGIKDRCHQLLRDWKHSFIELQPPKVEEDTVMQEAQ